jgi:MFS transporter, ACS family, solute carrier family 17 (sodium-dependent inorganic phosphate cotransporter), other
VIARRKVVVGLAFLASTLGYTDRVNISVAAVAMKEHLGWSQTQKGMVLSAFFVGYMLFMFASGLLATRYGGKVVLGVSVLAWSLFTLVTPLAATTSMTALLAVRIGMGLGEAGMYPATYELFGRWVPLEERARAVARLLSGVPFGTVVGLLATGWLVQHHGWPMAFYAFGALGLVWAAAWFREVENTPAADPRVGAEERALLAADQPTAGEAVRPSLGHLLGRAPVIGIVAAHFASTFSLYVLLSWLPSYFREVQHLSFANAGLFSAGPWVAMFAVTNVGAALSDRMIARGISVTATRKWMQCTGLVVSALFLLATRGAHSPFAALALVCAATGALGLTWCGYAPGIIDVLPHHSALLGGFSNTVATIPGIIGVTAIGWLVDVTGTYSAGFAVTAAVSALGAVAFALLFEARPLVA